MKMKFWSALALLSTHALMYAGCGYIIKNQTQEGTSAGGTISVRIQQGATDASQVIQVPVGQEKELIMHDNELCPIPRLILAGGQDGDIKGMGTSYKLQAQGKADDVGGKFHKMVICVKSTGFNLADKTKRAIVIEVTTVKKPGEAA